MRSISHFAIGLTVVFFPASVRGVGANDVERYGRPIVIEVGERAHDAVCFGCPIRVLGSLEGDAVAIGGHIEIEGNLDGDAVAVGGNIRLGPAAKASGDVVAVGGVIDRDPQARVSGDMQSSMPLLGRMHLNGPWGLLLLALLAGWAMNLVLALASYLIAGRRRVEVVAGTAREHVGLALLTGVGVVAAATMLFFFSSYMGRLRSVLTILVSIVLFVALVLGYTGITAWVGKRPARGKSPLVGVMLGTVLITALQLVPVLGWLAFLVFMILALGSAAASGFGRATDWLPRRFAGRAVVPPPSPPTAS